MGGEYKIARYGVWGSALNSGILPDSATNERSAQEMLALFRNHSTANGGSFYGTGHGLRRGHGQVIAF